MKKISALTLTLILLACFSTAPADAGAARRHTIEGFVLGTGVALLGTAIIHGMNNDKQCAPNYPRYTRHKNYRHQRLHAKYDSGPRGHWEIQKVWVENKHKKRWNPGHTTPRGHWVEGRYKKIRVQKGHWQEQRVWVETKYKHR